MYPHKYQLLKNKKKKPLQLLLSFRAGDETRTRDPNLGKVVLYQLSYSRIKKECKDTAVVNIVNSKPKKNPPFHPFSGLLPAFQLFTGTLPPLKKQCLKHSPAPKNTPEK